MGKSRWGQLSGFLGAYGILTHDLTPDDMVLIGSKLFDVSGRSIGETAANIERLGRGERKRRATKNLRRIDPHILSEKNRYAAKSVASDRVRRGDRAAAATAVLKAVKTGAYRAGGTVLLRDGKWLALDNDGNILSEHDSNSSAWRVVDRLPMVAIELESQ